MNSNIFLNLNKTECKFSFVVMQNIHCVGTSDKGIIAFLCLSTAISYKRFSINLLPISYLSVKSSLIGRVITIVKNIISRAVIESSLALDPITTKI